MAYLLNPMRIFQVKIIAARRHVLRADLPSLLGFPPRSEPIRLIAPPGNFGHKFVKLHGLGFVVAGNTCRIRMLIKPNLFGGRAAKLPEAGWHFTYVGGAEKIRAKLNAFSHTDGWHEYMRTPGAVERHIQIGYVVGNFWHLATYVPIDRTFPTFVQKNRDELIKKTMIKEISTALEELQMHFREFEHAVRKSHLNVIKTREKYAAVLQQFGIKMFQEEEAFITGSMPSL